MHFTNRAITWTRVLRTLFSGLLITALGLATVGCDAGGANGGGEEDTTPPSAPSGLTTDAADALVDLSWEAIDDADSYNIYRATSPTDEISGSALDTGISSTSYADEDAENGTTYYYRVTAVDTAGNESDGSGEAQSTPFTDPTDLEGTSKDSQIELSWSAADGADTYNVYRSTESTDGAEGDPLETGVSKVNYTDKTAENGTKYYYRVTSVNPEEEESPASGEVAKTPFSDPNRP